MNYEEKIAALKEKGIFSEEQAQRVANSFEKKEAGSLPHTKRTYTLEMVGALLLGSALLYIFIAVGSTGGAGGVEDISHSLNAPIDSGMSGQGSFVLLIVLVTIALYGVLYLYAHKRFRMFWRLAEKMAVLQENIHHTEVMKKELSQTLERLLQEEKEPESVVVSSSIRSDVMETIKETEAFLLAQKEQLTALEKKCLRRQQLFPDSLAKLAGKLPSCE